MTANTLENLEYYPDGKAVEKGTFIKGVEFDEDMGAQMWNNCGYAPNFTEIIDSWKKSWS